MGLYTAGSCKASSLTPIHSCELGIRQYTIPGNEAIVIQAASVWGLVVVFHPTGLTLYYHWSIAPSTMWWQAMMLWRTWEWDYCCTVLPYSVSPSSAFVVLGDQPADSFWTQTFWTQDYLPTSHQVPQPGVIQWNPSKTDTIGTQHFVHYSEVSLTQWLPVYFR